MFKLIITLNLFIPVYFVISQCGCPKEKILKRSLETVRLGDMLLDKIDIAMINGFKNYYKDNKKWPNNSVLFSFGKSFPKDMKDFIRQTLKDLQNDLEGCIKFQESTANHYIEINSKAEGCYSLLGYTEGPNQPLNLEDPNCLYSQGTVKHEIIHALGFMHTHMRKDRDLFISINWENILTSECSQFIKCLGCDFDGPYETNSVMHYKSEAFSCNSNEKTILKKDGEYIKYNHDTTRNDLNMIKSLYGCH